MPRFTGWLRVRRSIWVSLSLAPARLIFSPSTSPSHLIAHATNPASVAGAPTAEAAAASWSRRLLSCPPEQHRHADVLGESHMRFQGAANLLGEQRSLIRPGQLVDPAARSKGSR